MNLVGCDAHADAGAADQNATVQSTFLNGFRYGESDVRVIDGAFVKASKVPYIETAFLKVLDENLLRAKPASSAPIPITI
ncbi:hypothetical protein GCM10025859_63540 [Alicyclobacillus fastidiosus]|nr:hypothetical protein GCM10025859_63540 [Alicyclobacillus fastidiosus]